MVVFWICLTFVLSRTADYAQPPSCFTASLNVDGQGDLRQPWPCNRCLRTKHCRAKTDFHVLHRFLFLNSKISRSVLRKFTNSKTNPRTLWSCASMGVLNCAEGDNAANYNSCFHRIPLLRTVYFQHIASFGYIVIGPWAIIYNPADSYKYCFCCCF